jgi:hypothetical protein
LALYDQNKAIIANTIAFSETLPKKNNLVYAHLLLPHDPYFTDSLGHLIDTTYTNKEAEHHAYLNYQQYANLEMKNMVNALVKNDPDAIVVIMSDHGFRDYPKNKTHLTFNNFLAVRFPDKQYQAMKAVKSNINVFRVVLNQYFNQHLPLLQDRLFFVDEKENRFTEKGL